MEESAGGRFFRLKVRDKIMELFLDSIADGFLDSVKLIPFLFVTYLLMEWIEKKTEEKQKKYVESAGVFGPLAGGVLGIVPQCGFSCVAANLYSGGVITVGVVLAVFMSTSDEMLPILISHTVNAGAIVRILITKMCIAVLTGYAVDIANKYIRRRYLCKKKTDESAVHNRKYTKKQATASQDTEKQNTKNEDAENPYTENQYAKNPYAKKQHAENQHMESRHTHSHSHAHADDGEKHIHTICEQEHCNCEDGIWLSALKHTVKITIFIFVVSVVLNIIIGLTGEDTIGKILGDIPVLGEAMAALVGLIPNCASSVIITELYLDGMLNAGAMMSGLLVSAGVGLLVLFRMNRHRLKENLMVVGTLYAASVCWGILINLLGITF